MFKIFRKNCCGLDVHKTWIYACIGITDANSRTEYFQARFSAFSKGLQELSHWLDKYNCKQVCMESAGKFWIPVFNILEKTCLVTLAHPKYTKPQKGNKTDRKDAKWICDLFMCDMIKPSFIPPPAIRHLRDLVRYRGKLTNMLTGEKNRAQNCLTVSNLKPVSYTHLLNDIDPAGFPALRHPCELARLCVSPAAQGQGVGSRFLHFLLEEAARRGFDGVRLTVSVGQKIAQRLYQREGFAEWGKRFCYGGWFYLYQLALPLERGICMERMVGTTVRGIRAPIIRQGDDIAQIVADSVLEAAQAEGFALRDRDVVAVTEAVVARAQGNYATTDQIGADVRAKFGDHTVGVIFPILSRNRFAMCLKGIAKGAKKIVLMLSYPSCLLYTSRCV